MSDDREQINLGLALLRLAVDAFKRAGAVKTAERVRLSISSAKGARRAASSRATAAEYRGPVRRLIRTRPRLAVVRESRR